MHARLCLFSTMILTKTHLTLTVLVLVFVCCHSFDVPEAKFEVFRPKGFKVSIPGEKILIKRNIPNHLEIIIIDNHARFGYFIWFIDVYFKNLDIFERSVPEQIAVSFPVLQGLSQIKFDSLMKNLCSKSIMSVREHDISRTERYRNLDSLVGKIQLRFP